MVNRLNRLFRRPVSQALMVALVVGGFLQVAVPAAAQEGSGTSTALEWNMVRAETALGHHEYQSAEGHYRSALLEGFFLLGLLQVAGEDLPAARAAFERATRSAAVGTRRGHRALALVLLRLGESEEAVRILRLLVQQEPGEATARRDLVRALALAGKADDAHRELIALRPLDLASAAALEQDLAQAAEGEAGHILLPKIDILDLAELGAEERDTLTGRVSATLARIFRNLGTLQIGSGHVGRGGEYFRQAEAIHSGDLAEAWGKVDLNPALPRQRVKPQSIDAAALQEAVFGGEVGEPAMAILRWLDGGEVEAAEGELREVLAQGDDPAIRHLLGVVLSHQERYDEAEGELKAVIATMPKSLAARQHLARVYLLSRRPEEATKELRYAAELGPLERDLAMELAVVEIADERFPAANRQLRSLSRRFDSTHAILQLAEIASRLRNRKLALDFAQRARRLAPNSEEVLAAHARSALAAKIPATAAQSVEPLAKMHSTVPEYQVLLGQVWIQLGNPGEAAEPLLRAVELDPQHQSALLPLGLVLNHESRYDEARTYLAQYLEARPEDLEALAALAEAEERLGEFEVAEERARSVLAKDADNARANLVIGMLSMRQDRFAAAREALERAVAAGPTNAKAHYQLSLACARLGDRESAEQHLELYQKAQKGPEGTYIQLKAEAGTNRLEKQTSAGETGN